MPFGGIFKKISHLTRPKMVRQHPQKLQVLAPAMPANMPLPLAVAFLPILVIEAISI